MDSQETLVFNKADSLNDIQWPSQNIEPDANHTIIMLYPPKMTSVHKVEVEVEEIIALTKIKKTKHLKATRLIQATPKERIPSIEIDSSVQSYPEEIQHSSKEQHTTRPPLPPPLKQPFWGKYSFPSLKQLMRKEHKHFAFAAIALALLLSIVVVITFSNQSNAVGNDNLEQQKAQIADPQSPSSSHKKMQVQALTNPSTHALTEKDKNLTTSDKLKPENKSTINTNRTPKPPRVSQKQSSASLQAKEKKITTEKKAAHFLMSGQYEKALSLYQQLAQMQPHKQPFQAIVQILQTKMSHNEKS